MSFQTHQILRVPRKMIVQSPKGNFVNTDETSCTMRAGSSSGHETIRPQPASQLRLQVARATDILSWKNTFRPRSFNCTKKTWAIPVTHEKLSTIRGVANVIIQTHQILRLPREKNIRIDLCHKCNIVYNAWGSMCPYSISPNILPATTKFQNWSISTWNVVHNAQSNLCHRPISPICHTPSQQILRCHEKWPSKILKTVPDNKWNVIYHARPIRDRFENDPSMTRAWNHQSATSLATEAAGRSRHKHFLLKNRPCRARTTIPNFAECCACHEKWQCNFTKDCPCHKIWVSWSILFTDQILFPMANGLPQLWLDLFDWAIDLRSELIAYIPYELSMSMVAVRERSQLSQDFFVPRETMCSVRHMPLSWHERMDFLG